MLLRLVLNLAEYLKQEELSQCPHPPKWLMLVGLSLDSFYFALLLLLPFTFILLLIQVLVVLVLVFLVLVLYTVICPG